MPLLFSTTHGSTYDTSSTTTSTATTTKINRRTTTSRYSTAGALSQSVNGKISNVDRQRAPLQMNNGNILSNYQIYSTNASVSSSVSSSITSTSKSSGSSNSSSSGNKVKRSSSLRSMTPLNERQQQQTQPHQQQTSAITRNKSLSSMQGQSKLANSRSRQPSINDDTPSQQQQQQTSTNTQQQNDNNSIQEKPLLLSIAPISTANLTTQNQQHLIDSSSVETNISQYNSIETCGCYLCDSISNDKRYNLTNNYEIIPSNEYNNDYSYMKFSYGKPYSQLSCMKLYNLINTDCTIYYDENTSDTTSTNNNNFSTTNDDTNQLANSNNNNAPNEKYYFHVHNNRAPIYDTHYLYIIDCRFDRKKYEQSHINTSIHYSDLLNDDIYLSPPLDRYTIIVLYDEDGTYLTSTAQLSEQHYQYQQQQQQKRTPHTFKKYDSNIERDRKESSDDLIARIKQKLNNYNDVIYLLSGGYEQFSTTYPCMCSNLDIRSTVDRYKYLTIYPNCVLENQIFIGSGIQAKNWKIIRDLNITHIVNCSIEHECIFSDAIKYLHCKLEDNLDENISRDLDKAYRFIDDALNNNNNSEDDDDDDDSVTNPTRILIHCNLGISRSSSILIAYLIRKYKLCLYSTFNFVRDKRVQIAPNYSFLKQLKYYEDKVSP